MVSQVKPTFETWTWACTALQLAMSQTGTTIRMLLLTYSKLFLPSCNTNAYIPSTSFHRLHIVLGWVPWSFSGFWLTLARQNYEGSLREEGSIFLCRVLVVSKSLFQEVHSRHKHWLSQPLWKAPNFEESNLKILVYIWKVGIILFKLKTVTLQPLHWLSQSLWQMLRVKQGLHSTSLLYLI